MSANCKRQLASIYLYTWMLVFCLFVCLVGLVFYFVRLHVHCIWCIIVCCPFTYFAVAFFLHRRRCHRCHRCCCCCYYSSLALVSSICVTFLLALARSCSLLARLTRQKQVMFVIPLIGATVSRHIIHLYASESIWNPYDWERKRCLTAMQKLCPRCNCIWCTFCFDFLFAFSFPLI